MSCLILCKIERMIFVITSGTLIWLALAVAIGYFAQERGRSGIGWGIAAAFFSPLLCFIVLLILKNNRR